MRLSLQLYTLRDSLAEDLKGTLDQVAEIGLKYVEFAGFYGLSAEEWRTLADERGLSFSSAHIGYEQLTSEFDKVVADAKVLGLTTVIIPWIGKEYYENGWASFGKLCEPIGEKLKAEGLRLAYHNHAFEFETDGLDGLYGAVSPDVLKAQLDLAWVSIGGHDPVATIQKFADRTPMVHLKDYDPTKTPQWRPAGQGILDWDPILAACEAAGVEFGAIELDESPGAPIDAVRESFQFFSSKGLS